MGEISKIAWTDATVNFWWGCTKVSPGCTACYAEALASRFGVGWGPGAPRKKIDTAAVKFFGRFARTNFPRLPK